MQTDALRFAADDYELGYVHAARDDAAEALRRKLRNALHAIRDIAADLFVLDVPGSDEAGAVLDALADLGNRDAADAAILAAKKRLERHDDEALTLARREREAA